MYHISKVLLQPIYRDTIQSPTSHAGWWSGIESQWGWSLVTPMGEEDIANYQHYQLPVTLNINGTSGFVFK